MVVELLLKFVNLIQSWLTTSADKSKRNDNKKAEVAAEIKTQIENTVDMAQDQVDKTIAMSEALVTSQKTHMEEAKNYGTSDEKLDEQFNKDW